MREFKFRAWDKKEKIIFSHVYEQCREERGFVPSIEGFWAFAETGDMEVMQYTGFKDKTGKEIYEGDRLWWESDNDDRYEVRFIRGEWLLWHPGDSDNDRPSLARIINPSGSNVKVVGNIYENPELLKKETE